MVNVEALGKQFVDLKRGVIVALEDVTFHCRAGEVYALLGLNGAGKTTTMRILSTVLKPTAGSAKVAGFDVATQPALVRKHIGFLSNSTNLYDRMTALEHVRYFGKLYGMSDDLLDDRVESIFRELGMQALRDVLASKMSTGMKQKVSIARAIVHDPPVLIFDEPTLGLDVLAQRAVVETVRTLRDRGKCIIYSTHIMSEVDKLCTRGAVIHRGRVIAQGELAAWRRDYPALEAEEIFAQIVRAADGVPIVPV